MATTQPTGGVRTLPRTRVGWWGFGMLAAGAALQLVQTALVWASGAWGLHEAVRVPVLVFVVVMATGVVVSAIAVAWRRDYSIMMIALAAVVLISLSGVAVRALAG